MRLCDTGWAMSTTINIRNVPDELYREATARAARAGMSLSAYVLSELTWALEASPEEPDAPPVEEILARIAAREPVRTPETAAEVVRAIRGPLREA